MLMLFFNFATGIFVFMVSCPYLDLCAQVTSLLVLGDIPIYRAIRDILC